MRLQVPRISSRDHRNWLQLELQNTIQYVSENIVRTVEGRKCVDGRYMPYQASGMIARPGGDSGYAMALLAVSEKKKLGLTSEGCVNAVYKAVARGSGRFCMHTDHKADPDLRTHKGLIGCGHLVKAATKSLSGEYDVVGEDMVRMVSYFRNIADISPGLEMVNLSGEHQERGVLVVHGRSYTVNSNNPLSGRMYFIYDEDRDIEFMKRLVVEMRIAGVSFAEMKKEADLQLNATLHNLAKGLPMYSVRFEGNKPQVDFVKFIQGS